MASGVPQLYECPKYVPYNLFAKVREFLFERSARRDGFQYDTFKSSLKRSELLDLLRKMVLDDGSQTSKLHGASRGLEDPTSSWPDALELKHSYAATLPFLESEVVMMRLRAMGIRESLEEMAMRCLEVQVKAFLLLHCVYASQTSTKKEPILLTPASWRNLLELCHLAHQLQEKKTAAMKVKKLDSDDMATVVISNEGADLADFRSAFCMLYNAGAVRFSAVPAAMNASNYRRWVNKVVENFVTEI
eukprot:765927-Hanusia_phi.AAC.3